MNAEIRQTMEAGVTRAIVTRCDALYEKQNMTGNRMIRMSLSHYHLIYAGWMDNIMIDRKGRPSFA